MRLAAVAAVAAIALACDADPVTIGRLDPAADAAPTGATEHAALATATATTAPVIETANAEVAETAPSATPPASASSMGSGEVATEGVDPLVVTLPRAFVKKDFKNGPFYFSAAFDGSLRYSLWLRAMKFSRAMRDKYEKPAHLTFFVNAAFYSTQNEKSDVGRAMTRAEVLVRRALTQQAINEGHDVADHGYGHHDGRNWTKEEWLAEIDLFRSTMGWQLFQPISDGEDGFAFPRFEPLAGAEAGATGAACETDAECGSGRCLELTAKARVCTQACNLKQRCPKGTACGAPMFREDTDVCIPVPAYPVMLDGKILFNEKGEPNRKHPRLASYPIVGFRAPYLAANDALYEALAERGYVYDTSQSASPGPPFTFQPRSSNKKILELALMLHPGGATIPMDYNYARLKVPGDRMKADYFAALLGSYGMGRVPWNIGHHFATWEDGAYLEAFESTVEHVLAGCPDASGKPGCEGGEVVSFRELAQLLL